MYEFFFCDTNCTFTSPLNFYPSKTISFLHIRHLRHCSKFNFNGFAARRIYPVRTKTISPLIQLIINNNNSILIRKTLLFLIIIIKFVDYWRSDFVLYLIYVKLPLIVYIIMFKFCGGRPDDGINPKLVAG